MHFVCYFRHIFRVSQRVTVIFVYGVVLVYRMCVEVPTLAWRLPLLTVSKMALRRVAFAKTGIQ